MPWKNRKVKDIANDLGISLDRVREKQRLIDLIIETRKKKEWTQTQLGKSLTPKVSQPRIAKIESGIENSQTSFDLLFDLLEALGCECEVRVKKSA